ncbi:MAG: MarR family winged helix-turn-helix transcriptional regulator [Amphritea sp.]
MSKVLQSSNKDAADKALCTLHNLRKATRAVSQVYDAALAPVELRSTQFSLLAALEQSADIPLSQLAEILVMDRTTLTRNLKPLKTRGLIDIYNEHDKRVRIIKLTQEGKELLNKASPLWEKSQLALVESLGNERWSSLVDDLSEILIQVRKA